MKIKFKKSCAKFGTELLLLLLLLLLTRYLKFENLHSSARILY